MGFAETSPKAYLKQHDVNLKVFFKCFENQRHVSKFLYNLLTTLELSINYCNNLFSSSKTNKVTN